jgi:hypothetical protein
MRTERGAIIIHVAFALMALLCFVGIVLDQGAFLVARRQAQNAADAGALGGAGTLEWEPTAYANATIAATTFANLHSIWGAPPGAGNVEVTTPITCPDTTPNCIRVDVMRGLPNPHTGTSHSNSFPTFMMSMLGINTQGTRATATAQIARGNAVECIKPWVVADKWTDVIPSTGSDPTQWDQMDTFDPGDSYTPPTSGFRATGTPNDYGLELVLKAGVTGTWSSGWTMEIDFPGNPGSSAYNEEIERCPTWVPTVGLYDPSVSCTSRGDENPEKGCIGVKTGMSQGPTRSGVGTLVGLDRSATWNTGTNSLNGSCMDSNSCLNADGQHVGVSARVVPLAIFNPKSYIDGGFNGTNGVAQVMNLLGFFVEGMCDDVYATPPPWCTTHPDKVVVGRLMAYPGQAKSASGSAGPNTFLRILRLVQ